MPFIGREIGACQHQSSPLSWETQTASSKASHGTWYLLPSFLRACVIGKYDCRISSKYLVFSRHSLLYQLLKSPLKTSLRSLNFNSVALNHNPRKRQSSDALYIQYKRSLLSLNQKRKRQLFIPKTSFWFTHYEQIKRQQLYQNRVVFNFQANVFIK